MPEKVHSTAFKLLEFDLDTVSLTKITYQVVFPSMIQGLRKSQLFIYL